MTDLPNPWTDLDSAPPPDADTAVASCVLAQVPDAAVGYYSNSGRMGDGSLPSGETEAAVTLPSARSESVALNILEQAWLAGNNASIEDCASESSGYPACGHLAATVDDSAVAAFSIPESAVPTARITSAGDIDGTDVSSPADDLVSTSIPISELQSRGFDPDRFLNDIDPPPLFLADRTDDIEPLLRSLIGGEV